MPTCSTQAATASGGRSIATPSSSSTSAAPHADDAARLPCLTTGTPAAAATTADIEEMLTVWAWSPPVPTTSTARPLTVTRRACRSIARGQPGDLRGGLALAAQRHEEARELDGRRFTRQHPVHHPVGVRGVQIHPGDQPREQIRPGQHGVARVPAHRQPETAGSSPARERRSTSATVSAAASGSSGWTSTASACDQVASQRSSRLRHRHDDRRAVGDLVLELPRQAHAAGGLGLAVEDREIDTARVDGGEHLGDATRLDVAHPGQIRGGAAADGHGDGLAHLGTVAEHQHCGRRADLWTAHARHCSGRKRHDSRQPGRELDRGLRPFPIQNLCVPDRP